MSAASDGAARPQAAVSVPPLPRPPVEEFRSNSSSPQLGTLAGNPTFSSSTSSLPSGGSSSSGSSSSSSSSHQLQQPSGSASQALISPRPRGSALRLRALGNSSASTSSLPSVTRTRSNVQSLLPITVHSGFLTKKGGRGLQQNWRKRWFVLTSDKRLFYFASQRDSEPKGIIDLDKYNEVVEVEGTWPRVHRFNLLNTDERLSIRTFYLVSATKAENDEWMANILGIISGKEQPKVPPRISVFDVHAVRRPPSALYDGGARQELYIALKVGLGLEMLVAFYSHHHEPTLLAHAQQQLEAHRGVIARLRESAESEPELPKMLAIGENTSFHPFWLPPMPKAQARKLAYVLL